MGANIGYYVVNDDQLKLLQEAEDFDIALNEDVLLFHEDEPFVFWRQGIAFGQGVKAWNPMLELLIYLDSSSKSVFRELLDRILVEEHVVFKKGEDVKKVWSELKQFSIQQIETAMNDSEVTDTISKMKGYQMNGIHHRASIVLEFMELFNAFYQAHVSSANVLVSIG